MQRKKSKYYPFVALSNSGVPRPMPTVPLVVFRRYLYVVPRSLPRRRDAAAAREEKSADVQRSRVNFTRLKRGVIRVRVIMASADCIPAVASRRVNYVGDFRVQTLPGAQPSSKISF
jgi:hypothetical protein